MGQSRHYFILTLLCCLLYIPGIFTVPPLDRDEPHFAQASKQMMLSHNYAQINFQNTPRHLKPPGIYWLQVASVKSFSSPDFNTIWAYRIPSVLGGTLSVLLCFGFARRRLGSKVAMLASSMLAASLLVVLESHLAVTDAMLLFTMVLMQGSLWLLYSNHRENRPSAWVLPFLFWVGLAAGVFIKGITPLVGGLTIIGLCVADRNVSWCKCLRPLWGIPLLLALTAAWLIPVSIFSHSNFLWNMFSQDALPKLVGGQESHGMPPGFFLIIFPLMFWSASLFLWHGLTWGFQQRKLPDMRFLLAWLIPSWICFELIPTKLPEYVLPLYPAIAILIAHALQNIQDIRFPKIMSLLVKFQKIVWVLVGLIMMTAIMGLPIYFQHQASIVSIFFTMVIALTMYLTLSSVLRGNYTKAIATTVVGCVLAFGPVAQFLLPSVKPLWLSDKIAYELQSLAPNTIDAKHPLLVVKYEEPSLVFAMGGADNVRFVDSNGALLNLQADPNITLVVVNEKRMAPFQQKTKGMNFHEIAKIHGFELAKGRWVTLHIMQR